jgi:hypothetical protein
MASTRNARSCRPAALPLMLHALGVRTLRFMACDTLDNIDDTALDRSADAIASAVWQLSAPHSQLHR